MDPVNYRLIFASHTTRLCETIWTPGVKKEKNGSRKHNRNGSILYRRIKFCELLTGLMIYAIVLK